LKLYKIIPMMLIVDTIGVFMNRKELELLQELCAETKRTNKLMEELNRITLKVASGIEKLKAKHDIWDTPIPWLDRNSSAQRLDS
jgi:hypothetical protein